MASATPSDTSVGLPWGIRPVAPQATPSRMFAPRQRSMWKIFVMRRTSEPKKMMAMPLPPVTTEPIAATR